jgi:hypothetical protein
MNWRNYIFLFGLGLLTSAFSLVLQKTPGYMDAQYYLAGGQRLAQGRGFTELVLWNYLDDPQGLPHPSHGYWMPLTSLVAATSMVVFQSTDFSVGRIPFWLIAASIPLLVAVYSYRLTGRRGAGWLAGALAIFSCFYLPFLPITDAFGLYMLWGLLFLINVDWMEQAPAHKVMPPFCLGILTGFLHLTRADGLLWLIVAFAAITVLHWRNFRNKQVGSKSYLLRLVACLGGYLAVFGTWAARNLVAFNALLAPGGGRGLWLTDYNDLFLFPGAWLTPERWWSQGLETILLARLQAGISNLQTMIAVQGAIFLFPLVLLGLWRMRCRLSVQAGVSAWLLTYTVMTVVFPYQGARGGFFHSGSALQPLFWALTPVGLEVFLEWGARKRGWQMEQARTVFTLGLVGIAMLLSGLVVTTRVVGSSLTLTKWDQPQRKYERLIHEIRMRIDNRSDTTMMVVNPLAYYLASKGQPAIVIPDGGVQMAQVAANQYGASFLLLEEDHPEDLAALYQQPSDLPGLDYLWTFEGIHVFRFEQE